MAKIAGITTTKNAKGEIETVTINMKKHGKAFAPILKEMGVIEQTQFEKECQEGIPASQVFETLRAKMHAHWKK